MFRISRITDYGIVILSHLATQMDDLAHNSRELSDQTQLPSPVVSKILKSLTRAGLLDSIRGSKGGYRLARPPAQITVVQMITALEGPVAMTECLIHPGTCSQEDSCGLQGPWRRINGAVQDALEKITLADLAESNANPHGSFDRFVPLVGLDADPDSESEPSAAPIDGLSKQPRGQ
jgi:FeS assembly SUF system regulator